MADLSLASALKIRIEKGQILFKEGDTSKDLYVVQFGKVRIYKTEGGIEIDLAEVGPGGVVGEVAGIDAGKRSATGVALETTEVLVIPVEDFNNIVARIPDWFKKIATILVQRLREIDAKIHKTMNGECNDQIAMILALMAHSPLMSLTSEGLEIGQKDIENELVDILQVQLGDISRTLADFEKRGLIAVTKGKIIIKDIRSLEKLGSSLFEQAEVAPAT